MTRDYAHKLLKRYLELSGLRKSITLHSNRHRLATYLLNNGVPLTGVKEMLGHSNIATTSTYLSFTEENINKIRNLL